MGLVAANGGKMNLPKSKTCKICKTKFTPRSTTQQVCGFECSLKLIEKNKGKENRKKASQERKDRATRRQKLKTRGQWLKEAQAAVNAWIRYRDRGKPCISCGQHKPRYDAGHYLSRSTHPELRFNEDNISAQCIYCNNYSKNAHLAYRNGLIERIGLERVEALEAPHPPAKWTIEELKAIKAAYKARLKAQMEL